MAAAKPMAHMIESTQNATWYPKAVMNAAVKLEGLRPVVAEVSRIDAREVRVESVDLGKRGVLATASVDGATHALLTGPMGDIREPTWGPLMTN